MNCDELLKQLNDYVDGGVDPGVCEAFERHLAGCNPCQVVVDNIRKTITLYKGGEPVSAPYSFQQRLQSTVRERWSRRRTPQSG
jgi:anti-sigma factor RsiW